MEKEKKQTNSPANKTKQKKVMEHFELTENHTKENCFIQAQVDEQMEKKISVQKAYSDTDIGHRE